MNNNGSGELAGRGATRREALKIGATGALAIAGFAGIARRALADCTLSPSQTEGPYWVEEMLNRSDVRTDPSTGVAQAGLPLRLLITLSEIDAGICSPLSGADTDI